MNREQLYQKQKRVLMKTLNDINKGIYTEDAVKHMVFDAYFLGTKHALEAVKVFSEEAEK